MKTFFVICLFLLTIESYCQEKFAYETTQYGKVSAVPVFDRLSTQGKEKAGVVFEDEGYLKRIVKQIIRESLSSDLVDSLTPLSEKPSSILIWIDSTGEIMYAHFSLTQNDKKILSDEVLYKLYQNLKKVQLDVSNIQIKFDNNLPNKGRESDKIYCCVYPMRLNPD
jgi:hypothetical protein